MSAPKILKPHTCMHRLVAMIMTIAAIGKVMSDESSLATQHDLILNPYHWAIRGYG